VDNHLDTLYGGAVLLSAISAGIQLSQPQQSANFGSAPSTGQTLTAALGQNLGQVSTEYVRRQMDIRPTIIIPNGEHFTVTVNKDMVLPGPWGTWE
jgi:type IV secretion system protein VirB10